MNAPEKFFLPDIQSVSDGRRIAIDRVGVKGMLHPLRIRTSAGDDQHTVARVDMYVGLPESVKGTHMSRFVEVLQAHEGTLDYARFRALTAQMLARLEADSGYIEMRFPFFMRKRAPVSGVQSLLDYRATLCAELTPTAGYRLTVQVQVPVTSLCPCSKEISDYGAHNQRSHITITARVAGDVTLEDLVRIAEEEASCQLWGLLKRPDEKYVTERAYDNPKFVEDLVRDIALRLNRDERVRAYVLESENFESIHNHSAYALVERDKDREQVGSRGGAQARTAPGSGLAPEA
jgi:GTP cyclohydrolase I